MIDYTVVLTRYYPNNRWTIDENNYNDLVWLDDSDKPSEIELQQCWQDYIDNEQYLNKRKLAYQQEGFNSEAKIEALWEMVVNQNPERIEQLKGIIESVDKQFPAPLKGV